MVFLGILNFLVFIKGLSHLFFFYWSNLIFWIVMGWSKARGERKADWEHRWVNVTKLQSEHRWVKVSWSPDSSDCLHTNRKDRAGPPLIFVADVADNIHGGKYLLYRDILDFHICLWATFWDVWKHPSDTATGAR